MDPDTNDQQRIERFLKLLSEATMETGVAVSGCGCCDSPYFVSIDKSTPVHYGRKEHPGYPSPDLILLKEDGSEAAWGSNIRYVL
jgi:hypothetical protein